MNNDRKPPIGIMPKNIWQEVRLDELSQAIIRYVDARLTVPQEWVKEYNNLILELF